VRRGGLGDTLLMAPVLRALRRAHPGTVHVAGVHEFAVLLAHFGVADAAFSSEDVGTWLASGSPRFRDYDVVVADDPRWLAAQAHGPRVVPFDPRPGDRRPLPQQVGSQLGLCLQWPDDAALATWTPPGGVAVVLAPGSGGRAKCWPRAHWLALAQRLAAAALPVEVLVGPVETERDDPRQWPWSVPVGFVVENDLRVVARRLGTARAFVGNDSGTTHLAAMLGLPTVALFGPSDAQVFGPTGPRVAIVPAPGNDLAMLAPPAVFAALASLDQGSAACTRSQ